MLDLARLWTLAVVAEHGSFSSAARVLHVSQPAVSRQIALLERQLQTPLLTRGRGGTHPTKAGSLLIERTVAARNQLMLAEQQVRALTADEPVVRLGSFFAALVHLSPAAGALLSHTHPRLRLVDDLLDRPAALAKLSRGDLDLALVFDHDFAPTAAPDSLHVAHLFDDPVRILLPAGHQLARQPTVDLSDLADQTWIQAVDGSAAELTQRVLGRHGLDPPRLHAGHGDEPVETQALVAAGIGVTLTHELTVIVNRHDLAVLPIAGETAVRHIALAYPEGPQPAAVQAVIAALEDVGAARASSIASRS